MKKVLVIGDICKDVFHYVKCERLCPEAPVPVVTVVETKSNDGNKKPAINAQIIDSGGSAIFKWTNTGGNVWDFGTIQQGDSPEFTFTFENNAINTKYIIKFCPF